MPFAPPRWRWSGVRPVATCWTAWHLLLVASATICISATAVLADGQNTQPLVSPPVDTSEPSVPKRGFSRFSLTEPMQSTRRSSWICVPRSCSTGANMARQSQWPSVRPPSLSRFWATCTLVTPTAWSCLASLYKAEGHYSKAEPLYVEAISIRKNALGEKHPSYAISLSDLAELYQAEGSPLRKRFFVEFNGWAVVGDSCRLDWRHE